MPPTAQTSPAYWAVDYRTRLKIFFLNPFSQDGNRFGISSGNWCLGWLYSQVLFTPVLWLCAGKRTEGSLGLPWLLRVDLLPAKGVHSVPRTSPTNSQDLCALFPALALVMPGRQRSGFPQNFSHVVGFQTVLLDLPSVL